MSFSFGFLLISFGLLLILLFLALLVFFLFVFPTGRFFRTAGLLLGARKVLLWKFLKFSVFYAQLSKPFPKGFRLWNFEYTKEMIHSELFWLLFRDFLSLKPKLNCRQSFVCGQLV